jgi:hypothetical protein
MTLEVAAALGRQKAIRNNPYLAAWFFTCHPASFSLETASLFHSTKPSSSLDQVWLDKKNPTTSSFSGGKGNSFTEILTSPSGKTPFLAWN